MLCNFPKLNKTLTKVSSVFRLFKPKPYGFERKSPHLRYAPGSIFFQRLVQMDYYTNKVNVLSQFRKKMCFFKDGRLFLPLLVIVGL